MAVPEDPFPRVPGLLHESSHRRRSGHSIRYDVPIAINTVVNTAVRSSPRNLRPSCIGTRQLLPSSAIPKLFLLVCQHVHPRMPDPTSLSLLCQDGWSFNVGSSGICCSYSFLVAFIPVFEFCSIWLLWFDHARGFSLPWNFLSDPVRRIPPS